MTGEITKKIFETAQEGDVVEIVFDNEHHFYFNVMDAFPPFFDDDKECVVIMYPTIEHLSLQNFAPMKVTYATYECIQQINVYHTLPHALEKFEEYAGDLTEDQKTRCKNMIYKANSHLPMPKGYTTLHKKKAESDQWGTMDTPRYQSQTIIGPDQTYQDVFETEDP